MMKKALLVLEDGSYFFGYSFACDGEVFGELVFNTAMTGYQEVLTDPSYTDQIVVMSYPEIGIYGINEMDNESETVKVAGFVVYRSVERHSNQRATKSFVDFLKQSGTVAIEGIDTRELIKKIRARGVINGAISTKDLDPKSLLIKLKQQRIMDGVDLVQRVSTEKVMDGQEDFEWRVAVVDCGVKSGIIRELRKLKASTVLLPYTTEFNELIKLKVDGVIVSNGPGDPAVLVKTVELIRQILKNKIPLAGICLGHQLIGLSIGAKTYKMKFGHRGINHPVKNLQTGRILITTHNHGYAVEPESLGIKGISNQNQDPGLVMENVQRLTELVGISPLGFGRVKITHISLNDGTIEGLKLIDYPAFSVQYHPEASPGPHDAGSFFTDFKALALMR
ncbi:MAG TPA: glutamine-hydrolyzing carbamoyl-phosphate synthase small subunit [Pseudothermotoga sp.]|nr:glutamine-hydrolyzing carbamoyl-phosphate synthase small subunit [Pseudothermotoga sp.]HOK83954.1 glutamine-hydrolyzing carbamoyl-phosphate synthase small subunit [Pseudothermotoga sp.]HPP70660.1 glutamine-hydrolyzing carbamoyl-phosphate synthase small subunit [Pseudothermotoga sp.]